MASGRGWLTGDWPSMGSVLNITAAAWTAGFQKVSEYMLVLALCLVRRGTDNDKVDNQKANVNHRYSTFCFSLELLSKSQKEKRRQNASN